MKKYIFIIGICLCWNVLHGQHTKFSGLIFNDFQYNQLPVQSFYTGSKMWQLPLTVDLKPYCPIPGDQGDLLSCVGWATGYGAMTIEFAIQNKKRNTRFLTEKAFSALFIYNQIKKSRDCRSGATIADAMEFLKENGNCYAKDFDLGARNCEALPPLVLKKWARRFILKNYKILFSGNERNAKKKEMQVKKALAMNKPVVVGLEVLQNFYNLKNAQFWWPDVGSKTPAGGHAMVVVAYDEKRQAFQLMNSWGQTWGDRGFIWIKYKHFTKYCKYGFIMNLKTAKREEPESDNSIQQNSILSPVARDKTSRKSPMVEAKMQLLYLGKKDHKRGFLPAAVVLKNGTYRTLQQWKMGQLFQVSVMMPDEFSWLYCFSLSSKGETYIHKMEQIKESINQQIIIPAKNEALHLEEEGKDQLVLLFSKQEITDFEHFIDNGLGSPWQLKNDLKRFFKRRLVDETVVSYRTKGVGFRLNQKASTVIVPVILEVEGVW